MSRRKTVASALLILLVLGAPNADNFVRYADEALQFAGKPAAEKDLAALRTRTVDGDMPYREGGRAQRLFDPARYEALVDLAALAREHAPPSAPIGVLLPPSLAMDARTAGYVVLKLQYWLYPREVAFPFTGDGKLRGLDDLPWRFRHVLVFPGALLPAMSTPRILAGRPAGGGLYVREEP